MNQDEYRQLTDNKALGFLVILMMVCFLPFLDKAFHIDEPMYIWTARQIIANPFDFYGFAVNWDGVVQPMAELMQNPPLSSYYLALLVSVFGWSEPLLHGGFLVMGLAVIWGTYRLARDMSCTPKVALFAALVVFCTPAFFVLANYVTCDMAMLAVWVWAIIFWRRALRTGDWRLYALSGLLIAVASLTKYFGGALIPLLLVYSFAERRRPGLWLLVFLLPAGVLAAYQLLTFKLYGHGLLSGAASYAATLRIGGGGFSKGFTGLVFVGGGLVSVLCSLPLIRGKWSLLVGLPASGMLAALLCLAMFKGVWPVYSQVPWGTLIQAALMATAGGGLILRAVYDVWRSRDPDSVLLLCWIAGTFVFACYINWTVSIRAILPMAPAAGLLLARYLQEQQKAGMSEVPSRWIIGSLAPALVVSIMVAAADYSHAGSARKASAVIARDMSAANGDVWFQGHWGFQYYMERLGAKAFDANNSPVGPGDFMVIPGNNSNTGVLESGLVELLRNYSFDTVCCLSTMSSISGAGFYTDDWGGLPYVFGVAPAETYQAFLLR